MIRNVILDWSGTLANDLAAVLEATNLIFEEYGRDPLSLQDFRTHFRLPFSGFYADLLPEAEAEGLEALYERFFLGLNDKVDLLPGALDFLIFVETQVGGHFSSARSKHPTLKDRREDSV